ncbi:2OG-Fe(II) oxygenase [Streptomyces sp. ST2-7A]|uniref:2OG-Fe(II) oxygenase n=1 Tax=Streptomyces sp. ST2-7A TaxID=2907214 RepID=UPI001F2309ED|nr:2OG-Fe(II) oxygenase [Streptomyces sp. ST2-7A]MCE7080458.1 2OG-Fe(II) oxygenase [Streptomyces sp. ST2-7A]
MAHVDPAAWKTVPPLVTEHGIDSHLCDGLTRHVETAVHRPRTYQGLLDETIRNSEYAEIPDPLEARLFHRVKPALRNHFRTSVGRIPTQKSVAYRYGPGVGFVAHHDEVTEVERERARTNGQPVVGGDITVVVWLSGPENYTGGALFFESPALELRPPRGAVVAFPATPDHIHGVRPIESGERITVIMRVAVSA